MIRILIGLFLLVGTQSMAQSAADWWYFGQGAGVHFESTGPVADTNGQIYTFEGCASISDAAGDLLFYTDGSTVWNRLHQVMPNGTGLLGNASSSQSAIIVPRPGVPTDYYIITVPVSGPTGMRYTLVDLTLEAGLGDVDTTEKNILLTLNAGENVCALAHGNGNGYWVATHIRYSDTVKAFEISGSGVNTSPVVSTTGDSIEAFVGCIKASPNSKYIGLAKQTFGFSFPSGRISLMKFNNNTGAVEDNIMWSSPFVTGPYGVEFSPNNDVLYISDGWGAQLNAVVQYDISNFDSLSIVTSEYLVVDSVAFGQIQLGPDERIYLTSRLFSTPGLDSFLHRINEPNLLGAACDWELNAVHLAGRRATMGLPPFLSSIFNVTFEAENLCFGDTVLFIPDTAGVDSVWWNFGDPSSGALNESSVLFPSHFYADTGSYTIVLIAQSDTIFDTLQTTIYIYPRQSLDLGPDTTLCFGDTLALDIADLFSSYLWSDSSVADTFAIFRDSTVYVTLFGVCDTLSDTIRVAFDTLAVFNLGPDTTFCEPNSIVLNPGLNVGALAYWNTGDTVDSTDLLHVTQSGQYILVAENVCGTVSDTVEVFITPLPDTALLPPDTLNCFDNTIFLPRPLNDTITYVWSDSSDGPFFEIDTTMTIWLAAFNECGVNIDTFTAVFNGEIKTELGEDTVICDEDSIQLFGTDSLAAYLWNTGDTTDTIVTPVGESKNYIVTITLKDCQLIESREVVSNDTACPDIDCTLRYGNVFTPNGDGWNDRFRIESDCDLFRFSMSIYNRWGQLLHESDNVAYGWDGYVNGEQATAGTYYFTVESKDFVVVNSDRFYTRGSFTLVR
ncbi:MAG: gliding motility-associated C-terminal domain-containing protein [Cryomorphaceae bacterium]